MTSEPCDHRNVELDVYHHDRSGDPAAPVVISVYCKDCAQVVYYGPEQNRPEWLT